MSEIIRHRVSDGFAVRLQTRHGIFSVGDQSVVDHYAPSDVLDVYVSLVGLCLRRFLRFEPSSLPYAVRTPDDIPDTLTVRYFRLFNLKFAFSLSSHRAIKANLTGM